MAVKIPENEASIVPEINDHVAAGYDRKVYIGKVLQIDDSDAKISFYEHAETLLIGSTFCEPKKKDEIWVDFVNILYVVLVLAETKRGKKFENFELENVMQKFHVWKNKDWRFFLVLCCARYSVGLFFICKTITNLEIETYIIQQNLYSVISTFSK